MNDYKFKRAMLFLFLLFIASLVMCIGYGAINPTPLNITGGAISSPEGVIYISTTQFSSDIYDEHVNSSLGYSELVLEPHIVLSTENLDSYVEYDVTVSNTSDNTYKFTGIKTDPNFYSNNDIKYEISNISTGDELAGHTTKTFKIKYKYNDDLAAISSNELTASMSVNFGRVYSVEYHDVTGSFPTQALDSEDLNINFGTGYTYFEITIGGIEYTEYTYSNGVLTIPMNDINGDIDITPSTVVGALNATVSPSTIDLTTDSSKPVNVQVSSTYHTSMNYTIGISNSNFEVVDGSGNALGSFTIAKNSSDTQGIYIRRKDGVEFEETSQTAYLILTCSNGNTSNTNNITISVPSNKDVTPPTINAVNASINKNTGEITVSWSGQDDKSTTIKYTINLYSSNGTLRGTKDVTSNSTSTLTQAFSGNNIGTTGTQYYAIVYGEDESGNSGASGLSSATTSTTNCRKSNNIARYSITHSGNNYTRSSSDTAIVMGETYSSKYTASNNYTLTGITVKMGNTTLTKDRDYTVSDDNTLSIPNVSGNLSITVTTQNGGCLVEGTEIMLANGSTKKIEDVEYTDLLKVWDYEHGIFTEEYPIWIEKRRETHTYQKTTFSDNSTIQTVGYHGIFSTDKMEFVQADNKEDFHVGTKVLKVEYENDNYQFKEVEVTNIEIINEPVNYYEVVTTTYYNVISDNVLTTDGNVILVNSYEFNNDYTWKKNRQEIISDQHNLYDYNLLKLIMPYYMFEGLRAAEVKYISNLGYFTEKELPQLMIKLVYINKSLLNKVPIAEDGNRYWMVTTSDDKVTQENKNEFMVKEGANYILPDPKNNQNFAYWYNTATGEKLNPGDTVKVLYGTHFVAIEK